MRDITTADAPGGSGPFSQAIVAGEMVYTAGQGGVDPETGEIVDGGIATETARTLENIDAILNAEGLSLDDVIKVNVFLTDIDDYDGLNETYETYFSEPYPARSVVEVSDLPIDICVEIETVAYAGE